MRLNNRQWRGDRGLVSSRIGRAHRERRRNRTRRRQGLEGISVRCFRQRQRNLRSDQKLDRRYRAGILDQGFSGDRACFRCDFGERSLTRGPIRSSVDAASTFTERLTVVESPPSLTETSIV